MFAVLGQPERNHVRECVSTLTRQRSASYSSPTFRGRGRLEATGVTTGLGKGHNGKEMLWGGEGHWEAGMRMRGSVPGGRENEG